MEQNKIYNLGDYTFTHDDFLLLDTNVWLYLFPAPASPFSHLAALYTPVLENILNAKATLMLESLVLVEYINRYCRIEHRACVEAGGTRLKDFKCFRTSSEFLPVGTAAVESAKEIITLCRTDGVQHPLSKYSLDELFAGVSNGSYDFVDALLVKTCRLNGWKMVSHDVDITHGGIHVLTLNRKLISKAK
jgi:predicted nucleic acid-binding protein